MITFGEDSSHHSSLHDKKDDSENDFESEKISTSRSSPARKDEEAIINIKTDRLTML